MKNDDDSFLIAHVDLPRVKFSKGLDLGIDFSNQIDAWSKMEFKFRQQIHQMRDYGTLKKNAPLDLKSIVYSWRERID